MTREEFVKDKNKIVPIRYDEVFKNVFGNEDYPNITAFLMSKLLDIPYEILKEKVTFIQKGHKNAKIKDKKCEKDIVFLLDLSEPLKINLEANINPEKIQGIVDRNLYYFSNLFGTGLKEKNNYTNIKTVIQYNFNNFYVDTINKDLVDEYSFKNIHNTELSKKSKIVHINIEEMKNLWYNKSYKKYTPNLQQLICIGALMMISDKDDFKACLKEIHANKEVTIDIERIIDDMNDDEEIKVRYYNRDEEFDRIKRTYIAEKEKEFKEKYETKFIEQKKILDKKYKAIEEKSKAIEEKSKAIEEKSKAIEEKSKAIKEESKDLKQKNKDLQQELIASKESSSYEKIQLIKALYEDNISLENISKYTNTPINELNKILKTSA